MKRLEQLLKDFKMEEREEVILRKIIKKIKKEREKINNLINSLIYIDLIIIIILGFKMIENFGTEKIGLILFLFLSFLLFFFVLFVLSEWNEKIQLKKTNILEYPNGEYNYPSGLKETIKKIKKIKLNNNEKIEFIIHVYNEKYFLLSVELWESGSFREIIFIDYWLTFQTQTNRLAVCFFIFYFLKSRVQVWI